jgi:hypothetical protein
VPCRALEVEVVATDTNSGARTKFTRPLPAAPDDGGAS